MIKLICLVDSFKHFKEPIEEYLKRTSKDLQLIKLKPSKKNNINEIIKEESILINDELSKYKWYKILLYIEWKELDTLELNNLIEEKKHNYSDIIFIIWWAYGVNLELIKNNVDYKLSISKLTFSHLEALMILLEQIYRCNSIRKWTWYHH